MHSTVEKYPGQESDRSDKEAETRCNQTDTVGTKSDNAVVLDRKLKNSKRRKVCVFGQSRRNSNSCGSIYGRGTLFIIMRIHVQGIYLAPLKVFGISLTLGRKLKALLG